MREKFDAHLLGTVRTSLDDLLANFRGPRDQGPSAYAEQMHLDHPELDAATLAADAVLAVDAFHGRLFSGRPNHKVAPPMTSRHFDITGPCALSEFGSADRRPTLTVTHNHLPRPPIDQAAKPKAPCDAGATRPS